MELSHHTTSLSFRLIDIRLYANRNIDSLRGGFCLSLFLVHDMKTIDMRCISDVHRKDIYMYVYRLTKPTVACNRSERETETKKRKRKRKSQKGRRNNSKFGDCG